MPTRQLHLGCTFRHSATRPTAAIFQVAADETPRVRVISEHWDWDGAAPLRHYRDLYANPGTRVVLPAGISTLGYQAVVEVPDDIEEAPPQAPEVAAADLPDDVLVYTLASRFCQPDVLGHQAWRRFGDIAPGAPRVYAVMEFVHRHLTYTPGSTTATASSVDAFATGLGVCRDFAHLSITLCRALNIPARYVHGYLPFLDEAQPPLMDFHAWTQVFLAGRWYDFDARWNRGFAGRCVIGKGRDAADVAMVTTYGAPWLQSMTVTAIEAGQHRP